MAIGDLMSRNYKNFRGIDLLNPANSVDLSRSPDCKNVWKSYSTVESNIIQTRPRIQKISKLRQRQNIFNVYIFTRYCTSSYRKQTN